MKNKIKQMINKEEGFTLVELLAVIVILGIIVAIAIPSIGNVISRAQDGANESRDALIIDAARLYHIDEPGDDDIAVSDLIDNGYLDIRSGEESEYTGLTVKVVESTTSTGAINYTYEVE